MKKAIVLGMSGLLIAGGCYLVSARGISMTETVMAENVVNSNYKINNNEIDNNEINNKLKVEKTKIRIISEKINSKTEAFEGEFEIPVIEGMKDTKLQKELNSKFKKDVEEFRNEIEKAGNEFAEDCKKEGWTLRPYSANTSFSVKYSNNNILSLTMTYWQYTGGAHGNYEVRPYNIDLKTGKQFSLKDLFKDNVNYKDIINEEINKTIEENKKEYFDKDMGFKGILDNQSFYIHNGNIVIYFGLYEIAPYSSGIPEFEMPYSLFEDGIKSEFELGEDAVAISTKVININEEGFNGDFKIPVIDNMKDEEVQNKINQKLENEAIKFKDEIKKWSDEYVIDAKKEGWTIRPYIASTEYKVSKNSDHILSITITYSQYTGGAHGSYENRTYNIDLKTGKEIVLKDIFKDNVDYKQIINDELKKQMDAAAEEVKKQMEEQGEKYEDIYAPYSSFDGITDKQKFYIEDDSIVVYFDLYEITCYAAGIPEFKISLTQLQDNINDNFEVLR